MAKIEGYDEESGSIRMKLDKANVGDNAPVLENWHADFVIPENSLTGTAVGQLSASDRDDPESKQKLHYQLFGEGSERLEKV